eukprot:278335-Chlamydomonas_euryale.AAC.15
MAYATQATIQTEAGPLPWCPPTLPRLSHHTGVASRWLFASMPQSAVRRAAPGPDVGRGASAWTPTPGSKGKLSTERNRKPAQTR